MKGQNQTGNSLWRDLIKIGRFGYKFGEDGSFQVRINKNFQTALLDNSEFFVIIDNQQVRFVRTGQLRLDRMHLYGKFSDPELSEELKQANKAWLAIDSESYETNLFPEREVIGMSLWLQDQEIGQVTDVFNNGAHDVLVVSLEGKEDSILIPDVDEYIIEKDIAGKRVIVWNIQDLIEL